MTLLARLQTLGIGKEPTPGTYQAAIRSIPVTGPKPEDVVGELRDESIRGNDAVLQGIWAGPSMTTFDYTIPHLYPDVVGDLLRAMIGPDTLSAGITTTLSTTTTAGATSISVAASIPAASTVMIDTGNKVEYFTSGTPTGSGPYTIPVSVGAGPGGNSLQYAHTSTVAVISQSTHAFAQDQRANPVPSYSLSQYDKIETRGYVGCALSDLDIKIDPKGAVSADSKWSGFPSITESNVAAVFSQVNPFVGWMWTLSLGGVASTRGLSADYALKRAVEAINSSDGTQGPREIFPGALESDCKLKAIFENNTDFTQFQGYTMAALLSTLTQPLAQGGAILAITNTGTKYVKFAPDYSGIYTTADIDSSSAFNATDSGVVTASLKNFVSTQY